MNSTSAPRAPLLVGAEEPIEQRPLRSVGSLFQIPLRFPPLFAMGRLRREVRHTAQTSRRLSGIVGRGLMNSRGVRLRWSVFGALVQPAKQSSCRLCDSFHSLLRSLFHAANMKEIVCNVRQRF